MRNAKPAVKQALPAHAASPDDPERQTLRFRDLRHAHNLLKVRRHSTAPMPA